MAASPQRQSGSRRAPTWAAALSGVLAATSALAAGELAASFVSPDPSPVIAVANRVIDEAPGWFVEFGKWAFGLSDKPALIVGTVIFSLLLGAGFGLGSARNRRVGLFGFLA
ncbi:MAG: molybdopterin-binding oxidoreductase, partial [Acidimicrobiia bacterium]|nr:molybdopterin-binding oxidoreductase [Acidimicrobiia bacterium]